MPRRKRSPDQPSFFDQPAPVGGPAVNPAPMGASLSAAAGIAVRVVATMIPRFPPPPDPDPVVNDLDPVSLAAFEIYDATNPEIYETLRRFALEAKHKGRNYLSISLLVERARWYTTVEAHGGIFKISNSMRAFYARKLMLQEPELVGFFSTRQSRADEMVSA